MVNAQDLLSWMKTSGLEVPKQLELVKGGTESDGRAKGTKADASQAAQLLVKPNLPKVALERAEREIAYKEGKVRLDEWEPIVQQVQNSKNVSFPLNAPTVNGVSNASLASQFKPETNFELRVNDLLNACQLGDERAISKLEKEQLGLLNRSQRRRRMALLSKKRSLLFYQEQKLKKLAKIKSKSFRRVLKKEAQKEAEALSKQQDEKAMVEASQSVEGTLFQNLDGSSVESECESDTETVLDSTETSVGLAQEAHIGKGHTTFGVNLQTHSVELSESLRSSFSSFGTPRGASSALTDGAESVVDGTGLHSGDDSRRVSTEGQILDTAEGLVTRGLKSAQDEPAISIVNKSSKVFCGGEDRKKRKSCDDDDDDDVVNVLELAFEDDNVFEKEFELEKDLAVNSTMPKMDSQEERLPGWGRWVREDEEEGFDEVAHLKTLSKPARKRYVARKLAEAEQSLEKKRQYEQLRALIAGSRKDSNLKHVMINERLDKKGSKLQLDKVPFPFSSIKSYEAAMHRSVGREWNTTSVHKRLITPAVTAKQGTVIQPLKFRKVLDEPQSSAEDSQHGKRRKKATSRL